MVLGGKEQQLKHASLNQFSFSQPDLCAPMKGTCTGDLAGQRKKQIIMSYLNILYQHVARQIMRNALEESVFMMR